MILIVEDDPDLARVARTYLAQAQFETRLCADGREAVAECREQHPDVVILDLGLPGLDGIEVCRQIRTFSDCYIIMLTARAEEVDKLIGLSVGADDYMTKPFSPRELVARVQTLLRRPRTGPSTPTAPSHRVGGMTIDSPTRRVQVGGTDLDLTRTEFDIISFLASSAGVVFSRRTILDRVWEPGWVGDEHVVDVHVAAIRRKLLAVDPDATYVETVRGVGYRLTSHG